MNKKIQTVYRKRLADTATPVSIYLKLRDKFKNPLLLESTDFHARENSLSFVCLEPLLSIEARDHVAEISMDNEVTETIVLNDPTAIHRAFEAFQSKIVVNCPEFLEGFNGYFGHTNFEAVQYFDKLSFNADKKKHTLPDLYYAFYRFVLVIDHFKDEMYLLENKPEGETSRLQEIEDYLVALQMPVYPFSLNGDEQSNLTDDEFKKLVEAGKAHCQAGDVFQIVFSRQFSRAYQGDAFNVYRSLRSLNPSPYLFYFDYGNYAIFGSSPEAQLLIKDQKAQIHPIAGTFRRTGDDQTDALEAERLSKDIKENSEHVMLVDLARNDLARNTKQVSVKEFKSIQYFSHVIHLVSKVEGGLGPAANPLQIFADTFPAGTLSGAPKYKAMQLIGHYENQQRGFYGGAIGLLALNGEMNQAIMIRSFLAQNNTLYYQAGAGIVIDSKEENELQEVYNKLGALKSALAKAEELVSL